MALADNDQDGGRKRGPGECREAQRDSWRRDLRCIRGPAAHGVGMHQQRGRQEARQMKQHPQPFNGSNRKGASLAIELGNSGRYERQP